MGVLSFLVNTVVDTLAISTLLSVLRRTTGLMVRTDSISNASLKKFCDGFLNIGEVISSKGTEMFRRAMQTDMARDVIRKTKQQIKDK